MGKSTSEGCLTVMIWIALNIAIYGTLIYLAYNYLFLPLIEAIKYN